MIHERRDRAVRVAAVSLLVAITCSSVARSENEEGIRDDAEKVAIIVSRARLDEAQDLIQAVQGQLSDLDVFLEVVWVEELPADLPVQLEEARETAADRGAVAVLWFDLRGEEQLYLYVSDAGLERILVRQLEAAEEGGRYETLAIITRSAIDMLLRGGEIGISIEQPVAVEAQPEPGPQHQPQPEPREAAPPAAPPEIPPLRLEIGIGYTLGGYGAEPPVIHGLDLGLGLAHRSGAFGVLGYRVWGPVEAEGELASVEIRRHPASLALGYLHCFTRVSLGGSLAAILDYATEKTRALAGVDAAPVDHGDLVFSVEPTLHLRVWLAPRVALSLGVGGEIFFNRIDYRERGPDGPSVIASPWLFQPRGSIGLIVVPI